MKPTVRISTRGRITILKGVRDEIGLAGGSILQWIEQPDGSLRGNIVARPDERVGERKAKAICNATDRPLNVWVEPWCDELSLPPRSTLSVRLSVPEGTDGAAPEFETAGDSLVIWAKCAGTITVSIDEVEQDTGSRSIELPVQLLEIPVKELVGILFGEQPQARPGGAPRRTRRSS